MKRYVAAALALMLALTLRAQPLPMEFPRLALTDDDRVLVLAPHPDDEVLTCGGVLIECVRRNLPVRIVFLTNGDNNQWSFAVFRKHPVLDPEAVRRMGDVRHDEALAAATILGVPRDALVFLGYPDHGTLQLWNQHWGLEPPGMGLLTRATAVPYAYARRPGAPYKGEEVLRDLETEIAGFRPTRILVSHPADQNPDHQALYLFTRVALWNLAAPRPPQLLPYLTHAKRWPQPSGFHPETPLPTPPSAPGTPWQGFALTPADVTLKHRAIRAHATQFAYSAAYLDAFVRPNELFGDSPPLVLRPPAEARERENVPGADEPPEELTETEASAFIGIVDRHIATDGSNLLVTVTLSRPVAETVELVVTFFGYRADRPFSAMPKVRVHVGAIGHAVLDQSRPVREKTVRVTRHLRSVALSVPLSLLGSPESVFTAARTYLGDLPLGSAPYRVVHIHGSGAAPPSPAPAPGGAP